MTQKELKELVKYEGVKDITNYNFEMVNELREKENGLKVISVSKGTYGNNGALLKGYNTKDLYAITCRNSTLSQLV